MGDLVADIPNDREPPTTLREVLYTCPWCGENMRPAVTHADNPPDLVCENGHEWWNDDWEEDDAPTS